MVAAFLLTWDISERDTLWAQLEQARRLVGFANATYQRGSGWSIEPNFLSMLGVAGDVTLEQIIAELVVEEHQPRAERAWAEALLTGDPVTVEYSIRHGTTGELRHLQSSVRASVDQDGVLLTCETTQVDVTDLVRAREREQAAEAAGAADRAKLLRQVSELLTAGSENLHDTLQTIADLAATAIGDGASLRVFSDDGTWVQEAAFAHRTIEGLARLDEWVRTSGTAGWRGWVVLERADGSIQESHGVINEGNPAYPAWSWGNWYVRAPAYYRGKVLGTIGLFRAGDCPPYDDADLNLLRVLADRLGATLEAERARTEALQLTTELQQVNSDQRRLVLQLDSAESRERARLADAVHDEPLQLAAAALLRLDSYRAQLLESAPAGRVVDDIADMLESCVGQLRKVVGTLTPPDLSDGLGPALRRLADGIFLGTAAQVQVRGPDQVALDPDSTEAAYRILHEALVNARKHAHATTVTLDLAQHDQAVTLRVVDDGVGLAGVSTLAGSSGAYGHLGLSSMRARAAAMDASLSLADRAGGGTVVELVVPRNREQGPVTPADANASHTPLTEDSGSGSAGHRG